MTDRFAETVATIAHELRSPLTSIKGFSSTLVSKWDRFNDDQKRQFIETINTDADRMGRIIGEVLDLARLESGRLELNVTSQQVNDLLKRALQRQSTRPGTERVTIEVDPEASVMVDADQMTTVFMHLIENGVKYSEDGEVRVVTRSDEDAIAIIFTDQGQGIAAERIAGLFDGASSTGTHTPYGSGLGLRLSRSLVERHGGTLTVTSEEGKGSEFEVKLPVESQ